MAEDLYTFVIQRERELRHQIAGLKGQLETTRGLLAQREHELAQIIQIRASQTIAGGGGANLPQANSCATISAAGIPPDMAQRFEAMTIKELVIQALLDNFPKGGALVDIRDFIQDAYGRDIMPSSLRPQMHRLKTDGILGQEQSDDTWNFRDGKRALYAMYDHPTSRKAMKELQDSDPDLRETIEAARDQVNLGVLPATPPPRRR